MSQEISTGSVNLARLLWSDDEFIVQEALPECFGDRYLCANNHLFAHLRRVFLLYGFRYSLEATRLWRDYDSAPLLMIQDLLDAGIVPYKDTTTVLRRVSSRNPSFEMSVENLLSFIRRNYLLHESAHCIGYRVLSARFHVSGPATDKSNYVLVAILCEAYANAVERLAAALATSPTHQLFYAINSYVEPNTGSLLRDCVGIFGLPQTLLAATLVFLHFNTRDGHLTEDAKDVIMGITREPRTLTNAETALLRVAIGNGFGLSRKFRTDTTPLFFRYVGCEKEFQGLCCQAFDPEALSSTGVLDGISDLVSVSCTGIDSRPEPVAPTLV